VALKRIEFFAIASIMVLNISQLQFSANITTGHLSMEK